MYVHMYVAIAIERDLECYDWHQYESTIRVHEMKCYFVVVTRSPGVLKCISMRTSTAYIVPFQIDKGILRALS